LQVGQMARIEAGPLQGMSGIVVRIKSGMKLVLSIQLLQRSIAVEIDHTWVRAAHPSRAAERHRPDGFAEATTC
jgi:transcription antitermination factor NusG